MQFLRGMVIGLTIASSLMSAASALAQSAPVERPSRLDCLVGYPDGSYRGDRSLSRYEFAAGLAACLDRVNQQIEATKGGLATKTELDVIRQQYEQMTQEVRQLNDRVNNLSE